MLPVKVALLGDSATQFLAQAIRGAGVDHGLAIQLWEAEFNQLESEVLNASSELYRTDPDVIIVFRSSHQLLQRYNRTNDVSRFAEQEMQQMRLLYETLSARTSARIIFYNYPEIDDAVFGNYANKMKHSFLFQLRRLNYEWMVFASEQAGLHICDLSSIQNQVGKEKMFHTSVYINTQMVIGIDALPGVAERTVQLIGALHGKINKCIVLDLDNTLWGGIIGDDGIENIQLGDLGIGKAFSEFQYWVKKLKERGVIVAVSSKNMASTAQEPFEKHPDMVLRMADVAVFMANWETKVDNIRAIGQVLSIGFDSMVFIDDNPFERDIVRQNIPGITVPEMPEDPAEFLEHLYTLNLFETVSFSGEDTQRTRQYQEEANRTVFQKTFENEDAYLASLGMQSVAEPFHAFNVPRVAQLSQRSNQFNLRTIRFTETDIERMAANEDFYSFAFTLKDSFGDHGLISVVILEKKNASTLFIHTWLMSCRVLKRGMEAFVLNTIADFASEKGFSFLQGEYIPTAKNELVKDHYRHLGFTQMEKGMWQLDLTHFEPLTTHIQKSITVHE